ncbi:MAG: hypothetical protein V2A54_03060 [Bacteroidota bacterium]
MKKHLNRVLLICLIFCNLLCFSQNCFLIEKAISDNFQIGKFKKLSLKNTYDRYYFVDSVLKNKLNYYLRTATIDSIFSLLKTSSFCGESFQLKNCNSIHLISHRKAKSIAKRNNKNYLKLYSKKEIWEIAYFEIAKPFFINDFAFIQVHMFVKSLFTETKVLLYRIDNGNWKFVNVLDSSCS